MRRLFSWPTRHNTILTIVAASVAPVLYLLFIHSYATNSFTNDDWSDVPIVHAALHGQLTLGELWLQHTESRYFIGNMIDIIFGFIDRLDLRSVIFLSAAIFIASYAGLLLLVRHYLGRPLTPIPVFVISVVWFSLADVQNSLWAAQISVFLTAFFFIMMLVVLLVPNGRRRPWFALGVLFAVAGSLSTLQGFVCWPVGAVCLLWNQPWRARRVRIEIGLWLSFMVLTIAVYLPGYNFAEGNICSNRAQCTYGAALAHPGTALRYFIALIGYVIPGVIYSPVHSIARFEALGVVLFAAASFIFFQSWRRRGSTERFPLPLVLILFSLPVDALITVGRSGAGTAILLENRYIIYNLILLTGIVIYGLARVPTHLALLSADRRDYMKYFALFALAIFLVVQVAITTDIGLRNARVISRGQNEQAEILVQPIHVQDKGRFCQVWFVVIYEIGGPTADSKLREAKADQLGEFQSNSIRYYRELGPPPVPPACQPRHTETSGVGSS